MKGCELCSNPARMYCESDRANLCWDCDEKVHCANFLVANHSRSLLCHVCESPTSWKASGPKLGPTVSVCRSCADNCKQLQNKCPGGDEEGDELEDHDLDDEEDEDEDTEYGDSDGDGDEDDDDEEEEEGENQVVPLSSTPTQPPLASCSSSEELSSSSFSAVADRDVSRFKRLREIADLDSEDEEVCCSYSRFSNYATTSMATSSRISENDEATSLKSYTPLKIRRTIEIANRAEREEEDRREEESRAAAILSSIERYQKSMISAGDGNMNATILGICELSRDSRTVDLVSSNPNHGV